MALSPKTTALTQQMLGKIAGNELITELNKVEDISAAEFDFFDGVTAGTQAAGKAVVANSDVNSGVSKVTELHIGASGSEVQVSATPAELNQLDGAVLAGIATAAGTGVDGVAAAFGVSVVMVGDLFKTTIVIDLTGLRSTAAGDIIGDDGTANPCHIGQITAARNGTIFAGKIECLELPAGGDPDIDLYSATEATGVEDGAISGLTETQLVDSGDHAANAFKSLTAFPAADEYLYLVAGATTDADYTAGILVIELWGA